jgi:hypothetical protein
VWGGTMNIRTKAFFCDFCKLRGVMFLKHDALSHACLANILAITKPSIICSWLKILKMLYQSICESNVSIIMYLFLYKKIILPQLYKWIVYKPMSYSFSIFIFLNIPNNNISFQRPHIHLWALKAGLIEPCVLNAVRFMFSFSYLVNIVQQVPSVVSKLKNTCCSYLSLCYSIHQYLKFR